MSFFSQPYFLEQSFSLVLTRLCNILLEYFMHHVVLGMCKLYFGPCTTAVSHSGEPYKIQAYRCVVHKGLSSDLQPLTDEIKPPSTSLFFLHLHTVVWCGLKNRRQMTCVIFHPLERSMKWAVVMSVSVQYPHYAPSHQIFSVNIMTQLLSQI